MAKARLIELKLPVTFLRDGRFFVAHSPVLDLSTSATTFEGARRRFVEAAQILIEELSEKGTLEEVLASLGWLKEPAGWSPPIFVLQEQEAVKVSLAV